MDTVAVMVEGEAAMVAEAATMAVECPSPKGIAMAKRTRTKLPGQADRTSYWEERKTCGPSLRLDR